MKTTNKITEMKAISNYTGVQAMDSSSPAKKETTMNTTKKITGMDMKVKLSTLWIFYMFSTAYIDITTLYYSVFINHTPVVHYTQVFLLGAAILVEIPIAMVLLSRILKYRANRWTNIIAGIFLTGVQIVTLFVGRPTLAYAFLSIILIATSAIIVWYAWRWPDIDSTR
ncbi:MAG TPA: DUF6326 family protein [Ktedonobacteraceae bacterium]|nr:DUF6326 family protein [Ktedonobacteraceae bacterium]